VALAGDLGVEAERDRAVDHGVGEEGGAADVADLGFGQGRVDGRVVEVEDRDPVRLLDRADRFVGGVDVDELRLRLLALEFLDWREWQKSLLAAAAGVSLVAAMAFLLNLA